MRKLLIITAAALLLCSCSLLKDENSEESTVGGYVIPAYFTEDDREVQALLQSAASEITSFLGASKNIVNGYPEYKVVFDQHGENDGEYPEKVYRIKYFVYANTLADYKKELREVITDEALKMLEENFAVGEEKDGGSDNGIITVTVTEGGMLGADGSLTSFPHIIWLFDDPTLYSEDIFQAAEELNNSFWTTAHITEKTDDKIKFAYIVDTDGILTERTGILKNEDGWKLSWYMDWLE